VCDLLNEMELERCLFSGFDLLMNEIELARSQLLNVIV
jgi:hypothetical protein